MPTLNSSRWYRHAFDADYTRLYAHRDEGEARRAVDLFERVALGARPGDCRDAPILDLACGQGRHSGELRRRGHLVVGLDLSSELLIRAMIDLDGFAAVRGDMRQLPFASNSFGAIGNFFTSFGYFSDDDENTEVAAEMARVLRPGGLLLWDHINPDWLRGHLTERSERSLDDGSRVCETRNIDAERSRVTKRIQLVRADGDERIYHERVRFYEPVEAEAMFAEVGLRVAGRWGDYFPDAAFEPDSRRQIVLFARAE
jgi:SAM-dependent methyltransferase